MLIVLTVKMYIEILRQQYPANKNHGSNSHGIKILRKA